MGTSLEGRVAIVTGAGRNVGRAVALKLARAGADVGVADLDAGAARAVAKEVEAAREGAVAVAVQCDVTKAAGASRMVSEVCGRCGKVDILVNNVAATDRGQTVLDLPEDEWYRVFDACVTSAFLCTKYAGQQMASQGTGGAIVNIGSTSGYLGRGNAVAYPMAKSALIGLTRSMAIQLGGHGIRVNLVAPNRVGSPVGQAEVPADRAIRNLVGRPAEPDDIANMVAFLVSDEAGFVDGVDLLVDGGAVLTERGA